ncbi:MAG: Swt1 family HEPN domain-containing protein [Vulcanimicrobiaceae bacterium]
MKTRIREAIDKALDIAREALCTFIDKEMTCIYGATWRTQACGDGVAREAGLDDHGNRYFDITEVCRLIFGHWTIFANKLKVRDKQLVYRLRELRHKFAHQREVTPEEAIGDLDALSRFLDVIDAHCAAVRVRQLVHKLGRHRYAGRLALSEVRIGTMANLATAIRLAEQQFKAADRQASLVKDITGKSRGRCEPLPHFAWRAEEYKAVAESLKLLAVSTYNQKTFGPANEEWLQATLGRAQLRIHTASRRSPPALVSAAWASRNKIVDHDFDEESLIFDGESIVSVDARPLAADLFLDLVADGVAEFVLSEPAVRRCIWCNGWFQRTSDHEKFDTDVCREVFSEASSSKGDKGRFSCVMCEREQNITKFSGLILTNADSSKEECASRVQMGSLLSLIVHRAFTAMLPTNHSFSDSEKWTEHICADCVSTSIPEWEAYLNVQSAA